MPAVPLTEIGYTVETLPGTTTFWQQLEAETTPELQWPSSTSVFSRMIRQDAQVGSVIRAMTLPIRRTPWRIAPNGARPEIVQHIADDMGLPIVGEEPRPRPRSRGRFSWREHLRMSLLDLVYGHAYFEQVYQIDGDGFAHIRKLAYRPARSISEIQVARDGGLIGIKQHTAEKMIDVGRLVAYVNDREGGEWVGKSLLRNCYKNWLAKDRLIRTGAQTVERNGMGIPVYKGYDGEEDLQKGLDLATGLRSGDMAGAAIDHDADLSLMGVKGTLPDPMPQIRYHDEQIARAVLAHFLNLGSQTGSWALGTTFADFFTMTLQTAAQDRCDVVNQHVIEDVIDINWGPDEPAPLLVFDEIGSRQTVTAMALKALIEAGAISMDPALEAALRQQYGLPPRDPDAPRPEPPADEPDQEEAFA